MNVRLNVPLKEMTTLRVGGPAKRVFFVSTPEEVREAVHTCFTEKEQYAVLGGGSNILVPDDGFDGTVIHIGIAGMSHTRKSDGTIILFVGAGVAWDSVVSYAVENGWWGIENLSGIPGTIGGSPIQNIGAYGVEVASCIQSVSVYDPDTDFFLTHEHRACDFRYRQSAFKSGRFKSHIIIGVTFTLSETPRPILSYKDVRERIDEASPSLSHVRNTILNIRALKFPKIEEGTAGSFFANPIISEEEAHALSVRFPHLPMFPEERGVKISLAWILDHVLSMKGHRVGSARLYEKQPLVVVTSAEGNAKDVDILAEEITERVYDATGVAIVREVQHIHART